MRMSSSHKQLPPRFADLEPFADWALADESERLRLRIATPMHEIETFYNTMLPQIEEVLEYLTGFFDRDFRRDATTSPVYDTVTRRDFYRRRALRSV